MKARLFDTIEDYEAVNAAVSAWRGYPRDGTERYAPPDPAQDADGHYVMLVMPDLIDVEIGEAVPFPTAALVDEADVVMPAEEEPTP